MLFYYWSVKFFVSCKTVSVGYDKFLFHEWFTLISISKKYTNDILGSNTLLTLSL
jgi:hypothetical protein